MSDLCPACGCDQDDRVHELECPLGHEARRVDAAEMTFHGRADADGPAVPAPRFSEEKP